jgi:tetratricopeptide (TPR) repeat protein
VIVSALLAAAAGICALPEAAAAPDAAAAQVYLDVGDAEMSAGSADTALAAYREAARLDPSSARARQAFLAACAKANPSAVLDEGIRLLDQGDRRGAIALFEELRKGRSDPLAALYEGICRYEMGDDEEARPLFLEAQAAAGTAARGRYFLGLIELRDGSGSDAAALFDQVAATAQGTLADRARLLHSAALRSGRGVIAVLAESGYDSNVNFSPDGRPASADGGGAGGLFLSLRPLGLSGPYLRGNGYYRRQLTAHDRDLGIFGGQAGWRLGRGETYAFADYGYEATLVGAAPYLLAHRLRGGARWQVRRFAFSAVYAARIGSYQTTYSSPYSGVFHTLDPEVSFRFPLGSSVSLGYHAGRDVTDFQYTSVWEQGPRAAAHLVLLPGLRASAEALFIARNYDAAGSGSQDARADRIFYLGGAVEKDFGRFTLRLSSGYRIASSNLPEFTYSRLTATLGASYTLGLF